MSSKRRALIVAFCLVLTLALALAGLIPARATVRPATGPSQAPAQAVSLQPAYGQLPLLFVENRGQTDPQVAFTLLGGPGTVFFTPTGVTYALVEPSPAADRRPPAGPDDAPATLRRSAAGPSSSTSWARTRTCGRWAWNPRRRSSPTSAAGRGVAHGAAHLRADRLSRPVAGH